MEQTSIRSPRIRRSNQQILDLLCDYEKGGVSVKEFCSIHNISTGTFYKWQSRYKSKREQDSKPAAQAGFANLTIIPSAGHVNTSLFAEVNGIKIYQRVDASYLKALL